MKRTRRTTVWQMAPSLVVFFGGGLWQLRNGIFSIVHQSTPRSLHRGEPWLDGGDAAMWGYLNLLIGAALIGLGIYYILKVRQTDP